MRGTAIAVALLALAVAGCGGGGSKGLSKEEYGTKLNQICTDLNTKQKQIGTPATPDEVARLGPKLLDAFDSAIARAKKLEAPDEIREQARKFLSLADQERVLIAKLIDAAKASDVTKLTQLGAQAQTLDDESNTLARRLGAPACAETG